MYVCVHAGMYVCLHVSVCVYINEVHVTEH